MFYLICLITTFFFCLSNAFEKNRGCLAGIHKLASKFVRASHETRACRKALAEQAKVKAFVRHLDRCLDKSITNKIFETLGSGEIIVSDDTSELRAFPFRLEISAYRSFILGVNGVIDPLLARAISKEPILRVNGERLVERVIVSSLREKNGIRESIVIKPDDIGYLMLHSDQERFKKWNTRLKIEER